MTSLSLGEAHMSTDLPAVLAREAAEVGADDQANDQANDQARSERIATALTVVFATVAVLFASFLAVVTGLV
jgi:hypothetical protein